MNPELAASYRWCWRIVRQSGSSFYRSFFLLPQPARDSMAAWYAFARLTDDLGDGDADEVVKHDQLAHWRELVANVVQQGWDDRAGKGNHDMLWPALMDTVERYHIPTHLLDDVIVGVQMDVGEVSIADWPQLYNYCYHVASAVGIACTYIWQAKQPLPIQFPIDCGMAFQLTNILRDVREDASRGRVYIPVFELEHFGCCSRAWRSGRPDGDWQGCIESIAQRAAAFYASGWRTAECLPADGRKMFSLIWRTYFRLLNQVVESKDQLWTSKRIVLPKSTRFHLAISHFLPWWYRSLPNPGDSHDIINTELLHAKSMHS